MPELAEVHYFAQRWKIGVGQNIHSVELHPHARVLRGVDCPLLIEKLTQSRLKLIETRGKQMRLLFTGENQLGIHLGMSGELLVESAHYPSGKHDHLILRLHRQALIFRDPRMFGRVHFYSGSKTPPWWPVNRPTPLENGFSWPAIQLIFQRNPKTPLKTLLLKQEHFLGIGNWMADEILWRAGIPPHKPAQALAEEQQKLIWKETRWVSRQAMNRIGKTFEDPPANWLFQHRWKAGGNCPRCQTQLEREEVGGRTSCWCPLCQPRYLSPSESRETTRNKASAPKTKKKRL